jgi:hypothetical protein
MIYEAILLASSMLGTANFERSVSVATDAIDVAMHEEPLFTCSKASAEKDGCADARKKTAMLLIVWSIRESAGLANVWGDSHTSIGTMQFKSWYLKHPAMAEYNATEADVLADRKVGLKLGLAWMRHLKTSCGSAKKALYAYASGSCIGSMPVREKVESRCKQAGGC